jgi:ATP synthase protein I
MNPGRETREEHNRKFQKSVDEKARRKRRARHKRGKHTWYGLGLFGLVGWSVAIPTVAGIALGLWIDAQWPSRFSWTLMLLTLGVALGALNAWYWIDKERREIERERRDTAPDNNEKDE